MNTNKNSYIFIYATILVVVVAILLAGTALLLKPAQDNNIENEKKVSILMSVFGNDGSMIINNKTAAELYNKYIKQEYVISKEGTIINIFDVAANKFIQGSGKRAFNLDLKQELTLSNPQLPLFLCEYKKEPAYVIPLSGTGLWGPLWGYICLGSDFDTVLGAVFAHKGETPGLGAEISTAAFQHQFVGKKIFSEDNQFTSVIVSKGGKFGTNTNPHEVDGISGGTITSRGTSSMIKDCLELYKPFFISNRSK